MASNKTSKVVAKINPAMSVICKTIRIWTGGLTIFCIVGVAYTNQTKIQVINLSPMLLSSVNLALCIALVLVVFALIFDSSKQADAPILRLQVFSLTSAVGIIVIYSGGALDSPFTAVLALFVGAFICMQSEGNLKKAGLTDQEKRSVKKANKWLLAITVTILVVPYAVFHWLEKKPFIAAWSDTAGITWGRVGVTAALFLGTAFAAQYLSEQLNALSHE